MLETPMYPQVLRYKIEGDNLCGAVNQQERSYYLKLDGRR